MSTEFEYIKRYYKVPAELYREVIVYGRKAVITKDMGNYIGIHYYDAPSVKPFPCHPTCEVIYLDTFSNNPPIKKISKSKLNYQKYLSADVGETFAEWMGFKK